jgi:hypothetical protein
MLRRFVGRGLVACTRPVIARPCDVPAGRITRQACTDPLPQATSLTTPARAPRSPPLTNATRVNWKLSSVTREAGSGRFALAYDTPEGPRTLYARAVVLTAPSYVVADLLKQEVVRRPLPPAYLPATRRRLPPCHAPPPAAMPCRGLLVRGAGVCCRRCCCEVPRPSLVAWLAGCAGVQRAFGLDRRAAACSTPSPQNSVLRAAGRR